MYRLNVTSLAKNKYVYDCTVHHYATQDLKNIWCNSSCVSLGAKLKIKLYLEYRSGNDRITEPQGLT